MTKQNLLFLRISFILSGSWSGEMLKMFSSLERPFSQGQVFSIIQNLFHSPAKQGTGGNMALNSKNLPGHSKWGCFPPS